MSIASSSSKASFWWYRRFICVEFYWLIIRSFGCCRSYAFMEIKIAALKVKVKPVCRDNPIDWRLTHYSSWTSRDQGHRTWHHRWNVSRTSWNLQTAGDAQWRQLAFVSASAAYSWLRELSKDQHSYRTLLVFATGRALWTQIAQCHHGLSLPGSVGCKNSLALSESSENEKKPKAFEHDKIPKIVRLLLASTNVQSKQRLRLCALRWFRSVVRYKLSIQCSFVVWVFISLAPSQDDLIKCQSPECFGVMCLKCFADANVPCPICKKSLRYAESSDFSDEV